MRLELLSDLPEFKPSVIALLAEESLENLLFSISKFATDLMFNILPSPWDVSWSKKEFLIVRFSRPLPLPTRKRVAVE